MEVQVHAHGSFRFAELSTSDMVRDKRFYRGLLGWDVYDVPSAAGGYSLLRLRGQDVAGLHLSEKGPHGWLSYVSVDSADRTAARARQLGAVIKADPFDVPGIGRMAMLQDPAGGTLALWQATGHAGARIVDEPGTMYWNELVVRDVPAARAFYSDLFAWSTVETEVPTGHYTIFNCGQQPVAGLMAIGQDWGPVEPHWQVYFAVKDCDAGMARTTELGGKVVFGPLDVPKAGRLAVLTDAGHAVFVIMQPAA